jgi:hypothetical protein
MSLRIVHILFITVCTLLCAGVAWWCFANEVGTVYGASFAGAAVVMPIYGRWFLKKTRKLPA